jgi:hypothetical protein
MTIQNLKDLEKLIKLCRKNGVSTMSVDGINMVLQIENKRTTQAKSIDSNVFPEENVSVPRYTPVPEETASQIEQIETDSLTDEQLLNWSSTPSETA